MLNDVQHAIKLLLNKNSMTTVELSGALGLSENRIIANIEKMDYCLDSEMRVSNAEPYIPTSPIDVLNLGAGVQSSTILIRGLRGDGPLPQYTVFADTGDEPKEVYAWLDFLKKYAAKQNYVIHVVKGSKSISDSMRLTVSMGATHRYGAGVPAFTLSSTNKPAPIGRKCTTDFKIKPITEFIKREVLGLVKYGRIPKQRILINTWLGISYDEIHRMKTTDSTEPWRRFLHPLVEDLNGNWLTEPWDRKKCVSYLDTLGFKAPKSSCVFCPYHKNKEWVDMDKEDFEKACDFDDMLRANGPLAGMNNLAYIHPSLKPLRTHPFLEAIQNSEVECSGTCFT